MNNLSQPPMQAPQMNGMPPQQMGQPQPQQMQPNQMMPPPPPPNPAQIQQFHDHLDDMQKTLDELIKKPDDELNIRHIFGAAADLTTKYRLSGGKKGASPQEVGAELASPDFPKEGPNGEPPSPEELRKFLQRHFDQAVTKQALLTHHFGKPLNNNIAQGSA